MAFVVTFKFLFRMLTRLVFIIAFILIAIKFNLDRDIKFMSNDANASGFSVHDPQDLHHNFIYVCDQGVL